MMNYLISAYSVNPYHGSEDGVGWNWVLQYEKNYKQGDKIILLTKKFNEEDTRRGFQEFGIRHIELKIVDVPAYLNWFREKYSLFHHMYYMLWQHWAWLWVKKSGLQFDVIHHVTMNDYRIVSEMYKVQNAKIIWGPVGGAQITPKALKCYERKKLSAEFRELINKSCQWNPIYKAIVRKYDVIYCINKETKYQLEKIIKRPIVLLPELAIRDEYKNLKINERKNEIIKIVFVGRLIWKKGITFLIDTLELMPRNIEWELQIFGDGENRDLIIKQIYQSSIREHVKIMGNRSLNQITEAYQDADIFVLPSLRETSGNVLLEAMAHAIPIVAFDMSFCSQLKKKDCGIFIDVNQSVGKIKKDFCNAILELIQNPETRKQKGMNGYKTVNQEFTWEKKYSTIYNYMI